MLKLKSSIPTLGIKGVINLKKKKKKKKKKKTF